MAGVALRLPTELARGLPGSQLKQWAMVLVGLGAVALDLCYFTSRAHDLWRVGLGVLVMALFLVLGGGNLQAIGLRIRPLPSLRYWLVVVGVLLALSVVLLVAVGIYHWVAGIPLHSQFRSLRDVWWFLEKGCVIAPLSEELIYRLALCTPVLILAGPRTAVLVSCAVFSYLHVRYGNFAPNHVAAGLILAWAYVRSSCLWLPIVLHALGNLQVVLLNLGLYYYQAG